MTPSRWWLLLGVAALAVAGLFSLVLVVARTPALSSLPGFADMFHKALVVHVDLSVLVWFLSIACLMISRLAEPSRRVMPYLEESALIAFALGTLALALSPLDTKGEALMSNYIPVITSPIFFIGLGLLLCGVGLLLVRLLAAQDYAPQFTPPVQFGIYSAGLITLIAIMCFIWSFQQMPAVITGQQFYERVFWGGGHVLQFTHTQIMLVCWLLLLAAVAPESTLGQVMLKSLFAVGLVAAMASPLAYLLFDVASVEHTDFFTHSMIAAGGVAPAMLALFLIPALWKVRHQRKGEKRALWSSLTMSLLLFLYGGALGLLIQGQNVVIPAHYHGSIVGVTLAFMGAGYLMLPQFGYRDANGWKLAYWQPIIYGGGQLLHISGLAWSGGYGVLRKTPGGMANVSPDIKAAMGLMGLGGLIAIIGGFLFVIVVWKSVRKR